MENEELLYRVSLNSLFKFVSSCLSWKTWFSLAVTLSFSNLLVSVKYCKRKKGLFQNKWQRSLQFYRIQFFVNLTGMLDTPRGDYGILKVKNANSDFDFNYFTYRSTNPHFWFTWFCFPLTAKVFWSLPSFSLKSWFSSFNRWHWELE